MTETTITDNSNDRSYFVMIPRIVSVKTRNPYDFKLWTVIKEIAGDNGECSLSTEKLAVLCSMSVGKVSECRQYLIECGLLEGELKRKKFGEKETKPLWHITIPDLWEENTQVSKELRTLSSRLEQKRLQKKGSLPSPHEGSLPSPHESIKDPCSLKEDPCSLEEDPKTTTTKKSDNGGGFDGSELEEVFSFYANNFNPLYGPFEKDSLDDLCREYGPKPTINAMHVAVSANVKSIRYVQGILKNQRNAVNHQSKQKTEEDSYANHIGTPLSKELQDEVDSLFAAAENRGNT